MNPILIVQKLRSEHRPKQTVFIPIFFTRTKNGTLGLPQLRMIGEKAEIVSHKKSNLKFRNK